MLSIMRTERMVPEGIVTCSGGLTTGAGGAGAGGAGGAGVAAGAATGGAACAVIAGGFSPGASGVEPSSAVASALLGVAA